MCTVARMVVNISVTDIKQALLVERAVQMYYTVHIGLHQ